jgi:hypothetical protein
MGGSIVRAKDIVRNNVKEKLARNEIVASITVRLVRGIEIALAALPVQDLAQVPALNLGAPHACPGG